MKRNVHWNGSRRGWLTLLILLVVIPATIYLCYRAGGRVYYLASVLIILYTMVPFFLVFERRKPQARELVVLAVLCAIAVASRAAFKMIDHFKPMTAIIMISGMAFGPEAGFLVGAVSGFSSNFLFGRWPMDALADVCLRHGGLSGRGAVPFGLVKQETASLVPFWLFCSPSPGGAAIGYLRAVYPDGGDQLGDGQGHLSVWSSDQLHPWGGDLFDPIFLQPPAV